MVRVRQTVEADIHGGEQCFPPPRDAKRPCQEARLAADAGKILRQVDAQHWRPFLFKQGESGLRAERCGKDQIGMQAQNSLSRGAYDREPGGLVCDEGQGGISRER